MRIFWLSQRILELIKADLEEIKKIMVMSAVPRSPWRKAITILRFYEEHDVVVTLSNRTSNASLWRLTVRNAAAERVLVRPNRAEDAAADVLVCNVLSRCCFSPIRAGIHYQDIAAGTSRQAAAYQLSTS